MCPQGGQGCAGRARGQALLGWAVPVNHQGEGCSRSRPSSQSAPGQLRGRGSSESPRPLLANRCQQGPDLLRAPWGLCKGCSWSQGRTRHWSWGEMPQTSCSSCCRGAGSDPSWAAATAPFVWSHPPGCSFPAPFPPHRTRQTPQTVIPPLFLLRPFAFAAPIPSKPSKLPPSFPQQSKRKSRRVEIHSSGCETEGLTLRSCVPGPRRSLRLGSEEKHLPLPREEGRRPPGALTHVTASVPLLPLRSSVTWEEKEHRA